jgi:hypothetical protein
MQSVDLERALHALVCLRQGPELPCEVGATDEVWLVVVWPARTGCAIKKGLRHAAIAFSYRPYAGAYRYPFGRFLCGCEAPKAPTRMVVGNSEAVKTAWSQIERRRFQIGIRSKTCR